MDEERIDFTALDPTRDAIRFEGIVQAIGDGAAVELARRRALGTVVGQISLWKRPLLAAATITALISSAVLWGTGYTDSTSASDSGVAEVLGVPSQLALWVRGEGIPTPGELLVVLEEGQ